MAGNKIYVQGSYIDIHDNENVYLSVDKAEVKMKDGVAPETASPETPAELQTEEARQLMESLVDAELLNEEWQPDGISNTEKALVAKMVADRLDINDVWQVFGKLWKMNPSSMRTYYNRAMDQRKSLEFQDRLKNIFY